ncbi:MAG: sulfatase [Planctomycetes bacterium]|nr:sulfatase [Planctomycetota bacterium]
MTHARFLRSFVVLASAVLCGALDASAQQPAVAATAVGSRPNFVFLFADDHAQRALSAYGEALIATPQIDRIARGGTLFRSSFVTNSICGPARAVILTGLHSHKNGFLQNGNHFDGAQATFPKLLQAAGYQTALFGKWHLESEPTGFDTWEVLPGQGAYYNPDFLTPKGKLRREGYTTELIADRTVEWLKEQRDQGKPFFLCSWQKAPHRNWQPAPSKLGLFRGQRFPEPTTLFDDYAGRTGAAREQSMSIAKHLDPDYDSKLPSADGKVEASLRRLTKEQLAHWNAAYASENEAFAKQPPTGDELVRWRYQRYVADYLRCIASLDEAVGRVLDALEELGLAENTIVVYSSDQGFYLGEHGWYDKRWMYEPSLRTPLLVRWPGVTQPGSQCSELVQNLDLAPTFLEAAGAEIPAWMQGRSLVPLLRGETPRDWRSSIYYHYYEHPGTHDVARHYGVRTATRKLIHFYTRGEWELFDLEKDRDELRSVHADPAYAADRAALEAELVRLRAQYEVPEDERPDKH